MFNKKYLSLNFKVINYEELSSSVKNNYIFFLKICFFRIVNIYI